MARTPKKPGDPDSLGRYRVLDRLGEGGQGIVYLGESPDGVQVAVKVLKLGDDPRARARLTKEMAAAQQVAQFCTAKVVEASVDGLVPYVVSEYIEGPSLAERVAEHGPLNPGELSRLMVGTASALTAIHNAGVVHRDLKPANVILGPDGPRVVDFGIARQADSQTLTAGLVGTPSYMAPEQLNGETASPASDVFSWAGTMVFAATGRPPFGQGMPFAALVNAVAGKQPDLSGVPEDLKGLLTDCFAKDPHQRPSARELLDRLFVPAAPELAQAPEIAQAAQGAQDLPEGPDTLLLRDPPSETALDADTVPPRPPRRLLLPGLAALALVVAAGGWLLYEHGSASSGPTIPAAYDGVWTSTGLQQSGGIYSQVISAKLALPKGGRTATITFEPSGCGGALTLTSADSSGLTFTLAATGGGSDCPSGQVQLFAEGAPKATRLDYHLAGNNAISQNGTLAHAP